MLKTRLFGMFIASCFVAQLAVAQDTVEPTKNTSAVEAARQEVLDSPRWQRMLRSFQEWMAVQNLHTPEQIAAIKVRLDELNDAMSAEQLQDFLLDMEERLEILMSADAQEARDWMSVLTMEARRQKASPNSDFLDAFDLSTQQLRQELKNFQARRAQGAAAHRQFTDQRERQVSAALQRERDAQQAQQDTMRALRTGIGNANPVPTDLIRSRYAPPIDPLGERRRRSIYVNPWGGVSVRTEF